MGLLLIAPVSRGQRVLQTVRDNQRFDTDLDIERLTLVQEELRIRSHLLDQRFEEAAEEKREQRAGQVQALVAQVVAIVELATPERGHQQPVHHVAQKVSLLRLAKVADTHMGQHLLLQDVLGVLDTLLLGHTGPRATCANETQRHIAVLDDEGLVQRGLDLLHHLLVLEVVDNMLEDVAVGLEAERTEHHNDRYLLLDVGYDGHDELTDSAAPIARAVRTARHHVHVKCARWSRGILQATANLRLVRVLVVLHGEDVDGVGGHLLLGDQHLLGAVDDEVAARVQGTLVELGQVAIGQLAEQAVEGFQHDRDLADWHLLQKEVCFY